MTTRVQARAAWLARILWWLLPMLVLWSGWVSGARAAIPPAPGGPILVVTAADAPNSAYYAEILRTEGLNAFATSDIGAVTPATLAAYDVVLLAKTPLSGAQATMFSDWVNAGGNLIAMAPGASLHPLLGIADTGTTLSEAYLRFDTASPPGNGIAAQTMQFHGTANRYTLSGASALATLYSSASVATANPAVTLRSVGSGKAAAFAFDLATSIVQTRQGNPAWAADERDGFTPIRSDDKFYGAKAGDVQADWVDLSRVTIPQADEQQRYLANLILAMNASRKPLPRFWYFPNGKKAVIVMTGDDHGNNGTQGRFEQFIAASPSGCSVANWECVRGTSYIYPSTPLSNAQAAAYASQGFEIGLHINTGCADFTLQSLRNTYTNDVASFSSNFPSLPALVTQRHHCIAWSDWATGAKVQLENGMRLDTSYYYWPPSWVNNTPGLFTGSAMPMRFADLDGSLIDVFMAATQMTDESGQGYPFTVDTLLDRALGSDGYYGAYVINAHTDVAIETEATTTVASAQARGVPVISSAQLLTWVDARNASSFGAIGWSGNALTFTVVRDVAATGLQAMVPLRNGNAALGSLTRGGNAVAYTVSSIKGIEYAFFAADAGTYVASYATDSTAPTVTGNTPANGATAVAVGSSVVVNFSEGLDPATVNGSTVELRGPGGALVGATVSYDAAARSALLVPTGALAANTAYTANVIGGGSDPRIKDPAGNALAATFSFGFTTGAAITCPCNAWSPTTVPGNASVNDPNAVELGVKFTVDVPGYVTGVRFYKGGSNTGTHIGNLWTSAGQQLATATFSGETASGWQQVDFAAPVAVTAGTVYVASYFAPNGNYAADNNFFSASGVDRPPVHLLQDGVSGGNGVYAYGPASSFPSSSYQASNYYVDVVFTTVGPADTTAPTVTSVLPPGGATGIGLTSAVSATFSEAVDAGTVNGTTFELRGPGNALVTATVSYDSLSRTASLVPSAALSPTTLYTATLKGGTTDPRIKDLAGNALTADFSWSFTTGAAGGSCAAPPNAIVVENCLTGNPASEWDVSGIGDASIQGYATDISVNRGGMVQFKVDTNAAGYRFDIYRMGYYGGLGARKVATVLPSASLPQIQPSCLNDAATGLIDCGNWAVSGSWTVPADAVSGIYFAKVVRTDTNGASHIFFVVRNDASTSDLLFQTSDTTWQAYNDYGGNSLYTGLPAGRAYKVSYNRPFITRAVANGQDWVFNAEYPMVRWLEANGYDVSYASGIDTDRAGAARLQQHKVFLSVGHDEYWSGNQRANVEAARAAGVNLAFFSGNDVFWKTRWENSIDGSSTPYRTLVSYKETHANAKIDPTSAWTGTWRDPRFSPPADGGRPENALSGTIFMVNDGATTSITVPEAEGKLRLWRNTSVATLAPGAVATMPNGTLGYEWNADLDNGSRPPGLVRYSSTTVTNAPVLLDYGSNYGSGTVNHALTFYKHASGAKVFSAGSVQWSWGLDATHDRAGTAADARMRQATVNLFADMGAQPGTLQSGLVATSASTDTAVPTSAITAPAGGGTIPVGSSTTVTGTATDAGGGLVGGVEVSVDGGASWHPATGRATWSYTFTPTAAGTITIRSRAVDDSGNVESAGTGVTVTVGGTQSCPCTIFPATSAPANPSDPDTGSVNVGVKFRSDRNGFISGIRFYKGASNTGTHVGTLWNGSGTALATVTFTNETASGWQQADFSSPVAITANTVYVASYLAPNGRYAGDNAGFSNSGVDNVPLHALQDGVSGGNGVYAYGTTTAFPTDSFQGSNYWVDVVFVDASDTTAPTVTGQTPAAGSTGVAIGAAPTVTFSEDMDAATINGSTIQLRQGATLVNATVAYNATSRVATLTPTAALAGSTTYTMSVAGGGSDPRVKDVAGNALAATSTWSFTTGAVDTTPPTITAQTPAGGATGVATTSTVTVTFSEAMDAATVNATTFTLRQGATTVPATVSYNATTRVATLTPTAVLAASTAYTASVAGGTTDPRVKDAAGNALAATATWSFTTGDTTPPTITAQTPANGATGVSRTTTVTVTFSEPMNAATITASTIQLRQGATLVNAGVTYNATTRVATLTPTAALAGSTVYTASVVGGASGVKDAAGNALAATATWSFTTVDATPPTITARTPASGATGVNRGTTVTVTFSEAMDPATINTSTIQLRRGSTLLAATVAYDSVNRIATLTPAALLNGSSTHTVTVVGGSSDPRVKDLAGNALAASSSWNFRVTSDVTAPTISTRSPASGATNVARTTTVTVTFSEAMDAATVNATTFTLRQGTTAIPATVSYNTSTRVATLTPSATLNVSTTYTASVLGGTTDPRVKDANGNAMAGTSTWNFTTAAPDTTPPTVSSTSPASGAILVSRSGNITATFNESMDPATISTSTFELRTSGGTLITSAVSYNTSTRVATLDPSITLSAFTSYTVTIRGGTTDPRVKDVAGNAMTSNRVWSFTTGLL